MVWHIVCFLDEELFFRDFHGSEQARSLPLYIHLNKCVGLPINEVLHLKMTGTEIFYFEGGMYQALTLHNKTGSGRIIFISDTSIRAQVFENVINQLNLGLQIFDSRGHMVFLNETCRRIESLIVENVIGKHLREIYMVDESYSTILSTINSRKAVKNRCDCFANRFGDKVVSINSGFPVYVENQFYGAVGVVLDMQVLSDYLDQKNILNKYIEQSKGKAASQRHINRYYEFQDIIGEAHRMQAALSVAKKVAASDFAVLLLGETGTGKEMFAQSLHSSSLRGDKNFIAINCATIPASIMESILFGTVKGSFTGSDNQKGLLDEVNGGTLFLDEINSMDMQVQSKLLRVLQEKNFRRVGGVKDINCDFRVVAAMNEQPASAISHNRLRNDLYYRLNTITIDIPPLRERIEDIPVLTSYYLEKLSHTSNKKIKGLTQEAAAILQQYDWPGNIRELFHSLDYAWTMTESDLIEASHFPQRLFLHNAEPNGRQDFLQQDLRQNLLQHEKQLLTSALQATDYNISQAAKRLNLSRQNLQHRLKKCGIRSAINKKL